MDSLQSDLEEIRELKARYFRLMDQKQWAKWEHCFAADVTAIYEGPPPPEPDRRSQLNRARRATRARGGGKRVAHR